MTLVQSQSLELRRSFYNALLDVLWSFGLRERAARVLAEGRSLNVFDKDLLAEGAAFEIDVWRIDLHDNSVGGGSSSALRVAPRVGASVGGE